MRRLGVGWAGAGLPVVLLVWPLVKQGASTGAGSRCGEERRGGWEQGGWVLKESVGSLQQGPCLQG